MIKRKKRAEGGRRKRYPLKTGVVMLRDGKVKKNRSEKKTKEKRRTVERKSFEDTRIRIRNFIEELERKAEEKDEDPKSSPPRKSSTSSQRSLPRNLSKSPPRTSTRDKNRSEESEKKSSNIREEYVAMQQSAADEALRSYRKRLELDMNREIQAQVDHEDILLKRETDSIEDRFESDIVSLIEFDESIEAQIKELEILKRHTREKMQELRICRDRCVDKCKEKHRLAVEDVKIELQNAMDTRLEEKRMDIQKKLAAVLTPSVW